MLQRQLSANLVIESPFCSNIEKQQTLMTENNTSLIQLKAFTYDLLYINDQAHIEGYQPIEEVFKNKMLN